MTDYAALSPKEKREIFLRTGEALGVSPVVIEKDLYVCWCLQQLFAMDRDAPTLLFKGGTSLSKVFQVIGRFSEDIDITIDNRSLPLTADLYDPTLSRTRIKKLLEEVDVAAATFTRDILLPTIQAQAATVPEIQEVSISTPATIEVLYSSLLPAQGYVLPRILIECGARNVQEPREAHSIRTYAAEHFPTITFPDAPDVSVLSPVRTFWEKATILHAEYHRPEPRAAERIARHWYDTAMLARHSIRERAIADIAMLAAVADYKDRIYPSGWASYATARAKTLRLSPHAALHDLLKADYDDMVRAGFFFDTPLTWEEIVTTLRELEREING